MKLAHSTLLHLCSTLQRDRSDETMGYLAGRRMLLASERLRISHEAIGVTALLLGYEYAPNQEFKFDFT
jgi:hypothetical protein